MYMNTRANLDYWSTDNCCIRWSLKTGTCTIGTVSLVCQALLVAAGVMMLVDCPVYQSALDPDVLDQLNDTGVLEAGDVVSGASIIERSASNVSVPEDSASSNNSITGIGVNFSCPWLPEPETEVLGIHDEEKLLMVASVVVCYCGIYCILSFCVVLGAIKDSVVLLQGWVAFTGVHNIVILAFLLVPLPFTTFPHLICSIVHFIISLYTWAVVKSFMHALKVEKNKPLVVEGTITDYTVDGVDVTEIPVEV